MQFEFIESPIFISYLSDYLGDDEYAALQEYLCEQPGAGDMISIWWGAKVALEQT